jgi:hypothetical protein
MQWLRLYHDTPNDPKWRVVSVRCGQPVGNVLSVWMMMLTCASEAEQRGTLEGWDDEMVAAVLGYAPATVTAIRASMQGLVLDGWRLTGWEKRQKQSDTSAERTRRYRTKNTDDGGDGGASAKKPNGAFTRHGDGDVTVTEVNVTSQAADVTSAPSCAKTSDLQKESKGESVCEVGVDPREAHTQGAPEFSETKSANVVQFAPPGGRSPIPVGWVLPAPYRAYAEAAGQTNIDGAARRFVIHWSGRGAKTEAEWRQAWKNWIDENIERGYGNGKQRHDDQRQRGHGDLASFVKSNLPRWVGDAEGSPHGW